MGRREEKCVRAGRTLLIHRCGQERVDQLDWSVDVADPLNDPLFQITGLPYPEARRMLGLTRKQAIDLGFTYRPGFELRDIPELNEAWRDLILEKIREK